jgi:hypothetical protein
MRLGRPIKSYVRITQLFSPTAHYGLDLSAYTGTPVYAAVDGVAYAADQPEGFGRYVRIETAAYKVYAAHLDSIAISSGQTVRCGQIIGYSGSTGNSTGPHLHVEVRRNAGSPYRYGAIDPWPLIDWDPAPAGRRVVGVHLGNGCPMSQGDRRVIELLHPGCVVFLPDYGIDRQQVSPADIAWIHSVVPDCHFVVRPYCPPEMASTAAGCRQYVDAVLEILPQWMGVIPSGQLHVQLWNEQNMPRGSGWEGFGDQESDMQRFDAVFCDAHQRIKTRHPSVRVGWTPLTVGHRDCWFTGDPTGAYYLHGATGCRGSETLTAAQWNQARREGPCYDSLALADELYAHVYFHDRDGATGLWSHSAYGRRFERMRYWWPDKPMWITEYGYPNLHFIEQAGAGQNLVAHATHLNERAPYVGGATLWILGDNPLWGGAMYHRNGQPISAVGDLAALHGIEAPPKAPTPPAMSEDEIGAFVSDLLQEHVLPLNPAAALYKAAKLRNAALTVASDERRPHELGIELPEGLPDDIVCQAFRNPLDDTWQEIAWTRIGQWAPEQIRWVRRRN